MFENFQPFDIKTQSSPDVSIHGIIKRTSGPPLVFLHGYPQTHHIWHLVSAQLGDSYTIIALDIRGYGASSKPSGIAQYAKSVMARDVALAMEQLGFPSYYVCAHDRGARVAHKLLVDYPSRVKKAILLDICPTLAMYSKTNKEFATAYWHWFFLIQQHPLPEMMISHDPRRFLELLMGGRGKFTGLELWDGKGVWEEYVKVMEQPEAVHSMCEDYRAASSVDLDEARKDIEEGRLIKSPLKVFWGSHGIIEKCYNAVEEWKSVADEGVDVSGESVDSGHYIPEEAPEVVVKSIREFFT